MLTMEIVSEHRAGFNLTARRTRRRLGILASKWPGGWEGGGDFGSAADLFWDCPRSPMLQPQRVVRGVRKRERQH